MNETVVILAVGFAVSGGIMGGLGIAGWWASRKQQREIAERRRKRGL